MRVMAKDGADVIDPSATWNRKDEGRSFVKAMAGASGPVAFSVAPVSTMERKVAEAERGVAAVGVVAGGQRCDALNVARSSARWSGVALS